MPSLIGLPSVEASAIALGTVYNNAIAITILGYLFGDKYRSVNASDTSDESAKSKEAATAVLGWVSALGGSAIQAYGVGALVKASGTRSYKAATILGCLMFFASAAPAVISQIVLEKRPLDSVLVGVSSRMLETVGLTVVLTWWGLRNGHLK